MENFLTNKALANYIKSEYRHKYIKVCHFASGKFDIEIEQFNKPIKIIKRINADTFDTFISQWLEETKGSNTEISIYYGNMAWLQVTNGRLINLYTNRGFNC